MTLTTLAVLFVGGVAIGLVAGRAVLRSGRRERRRESPFASLGRGAMNKLKAILCLIYVLSPIDIVPEAVLGPLGLADDIVVALVGLRHWFRHSR